MQLFKQLERKLFKILNYNSNGFDVFDFRVGTLIGTGVLFIVPFTNKHFTQPIPDIPYARNTLIAIQILSIFLSFHFSFIKKWANEIGNLFSLIYAIIISTALYFENFENTQTIYTIIMIVGIMGMFKYQKTMTIFIILITSYFLSLVWIKNMDNQKFISTIAVLIFSTGYYVFYIKLDYVQRLRKRENQLIASESWFRNIFNNTPVGIVMLNSNYRAFKANQYFQKMTGYTEKELLEKGLRGMIHPDDYMCPDTFRHFLKTENAQIEQRLYHKSGKILWVQLTTSQMTVNDKLYTISMFNDISMARTANLQMRESSRQMKAQNESLEEFSYVISHDLQEPLRMITAFSQLIQRRYISPLENDDAQRDFKFVIDGAKRMSTLIKDMREYTRWSAQALPVETVDVQEALLEAKQNLMVAINQKNAVIKTNDLPFVETNRLMLVQVFQNLIGNAIKYRHPTRQPIIEISALKLEKEWLFKCKDNGIGFDEQHKERIFGIFQRLNNDRVTGNGIGLAICKRIIEKQGGKIWAESVIGIGSVFSFSIPILDENSLLIKEGLFENLLEEEHV